MSKDQMQQWFGKAGTALAALVGGYATTQLHFMTDSIVKLNENVAVLIEQVGTQKNNQDTNDSDIKDLKERVGSLEGFTFGGHEPRAGRPRRGGR